MKNEYTHKIYRASTFVEKIVNGKVVERTMYNHAHARKIAQEQRDQGANVNEVRVIDW